MKKIRIFLASSIYELEQDRRDLGDYISSLDEMLRDRGIDLRMIQCEHMTNSMHPQRKEDAYIEKVNTCDYFYVLFGMRVGKYTREEFEAAWSRMKATGAPRIYTYHKLLPDGREPEASSVEFLERLEKELKHFCSRYVHLDSVKLNILLELTRNEDLDGRMEFRDGIAMLDGKAVLQLNNVPVYGNNEDLQLRRRRLERLNREFAAMAVEREQCPDDDVLEEAWEELAIRRAALSDQIRQQEMSILQLCLRISEQNSSGKQLTWREKRASMCFERGDYEGALAILRDTAREQELAQAEQAKDMAMKIIRQNESTIRGYINENRFRIQTLMTKGITGDTLEEIHRCYGKNMELALRHGLELRCLYEYASFLLDQREYPRGLEVARQLLNRYQNGAATEEEKARLWNLLGSLYGGNRDYSQAEDAYEEALKIRSGLADQDAAAHTPAVMRICNNRAVFLQYTNCFREAEMLYRRALAAAQPLHPEKARRWRADTAMICNNLAILLQNTGRWQEAERLYRQALDHLQGQTAADAHIQKADMAMLWNNLASLLQDTGCFEPALTMYRQALETRLELFADNPQAYKPAVAMTRENMAALLTCMGCYREAMEQYRELLEIRLELAAGNTAAYRPAIALTWGNMGILLAAMGNYREAEELYREALAIRRELAADNPVAYRPDVALVCNNLAVMLHKTGRYTEAEPMYREALETYRMLASVTPLAYDRLVSQVEINLTVLLSGIGTATEIPALRKEARLLRGED